MTFQDSNTIDHGDFTSLASWPSGRAWGWARTKMVGPIASAATEHTMKKNNNNLQKAEHIQYIAT